MVVLEGYDLSALGYVVPQLVEAWHVPPIAFTPALTASNIGMFLGAVVCGWLGDQCGRKPVLLGCIAAFGGATLLTAFVTDANQLTVARFATGVGLGGGIPVCIALVSDISPPHRQGTLVITMITGSWSGISPQVLRPLAYCRRSAGSLSSSWAGSRSKV